MSLLIFVFLAALIVLLITNFFYKKRGA